MADNPIINNDGDFLSVPPDLSPGENVTPEQSILEISSVIQAAVSKLNGGIKLGTTMNGSRIGNLDGQRVTVIFADADTERKVPHGLGRVPVGYIPVRKDRACDIYDSTETAWGESLFSVKCDTADAQVDLWVF